MSITGDRDHPPVDRRPDFLRAWATHEVARARRLPGDGRTPDVVLEDITTSLAQRASTALVTRDFRAGLIVEIAQAHTRMAPIAQDLMGHANKRLNELSTPSEGEIDVTDEVLAATERELAEAKTRAYGNRPLDDLRAFGEQEFKGELNFRGLGALETRLDSLQEDPVVRAHIDSLHGLPQ